MPSDRTDWIGRDVSQTEPFDSSICEPCREPDWRNLLHRRASALLQPAISGFTQRKPGRVRLTRQTERAASPVAIIAHWW